MRPITSQRPDGMTPEMLAVLCVKVADALGGAHSERKWMTTGEIDVPGWVLGEMYRAGTIEGRKRGNANPNEWRRL